MIATNGHASGLAPGEFDEELAGNRLLQVRRPKLGGDRQTLRAHLALFDGERRRIAEDWVTFAPEGTQGGAALNLSPLVFETVAAKLRVAAVEFPRFPVSPFPLTGDTAIPAPSFPVDAFSPTVRSFLTAAACALDVAPEFVGVPLLAFAGGTLGKRYHLQVKPGHNEWPILYVAIVGGPGSGKSPALALARSALDRRQRHAWSTYERAMVAYRDEKAAWDRLKAKRSATLPLEPAEPVLAHYYTTDATMEGLGKVLTTSPGLTLIADELVSWVKTCDQYRAGGKGNDRQKWLGGWSKDPWKIDRKGGPPLYLPDPVVCVAGGIQPDILPELAHEKQARDGFIERILWAYPEEHYPDDTDETIPDDLFDGLYRLFLHLRPVERTGADDPSHAIRLQPMARGIWKAWRRDNTALLANATGTVQGYYAKLPSQAARLALILHCLDAAEDGRSPEEHAVPAAILTAALDLAEYFRGMFYRVLPRFGERTSQGVPIGPGSCVGKVAAILNAARPAPVMKSAIGEGLHWNFSKDEISAALNYLREQGQAEPCEGPAPKTGRPPEYWRSCAYG